VGHIGPARETWHAWSPAACPCPTARTKNEELPVCGIVGFHGHDDRDLLQAMNDQLVHRGPDGDGIFLDGTVGLGHWRLTIIDTSHEADQPMWSEDRRHVIIFNGEIYNFRELRKELEAKGHRFRFQSDTEVILAGYAEWGQDVLKHLLGMFAFALYDTHTRELFIGRDRLGIKPFYYVEAPFFAFASEIKALMKVPGVSKAVNAEALARFLKFRVHDSDEQTFFAGVKRLMPGHSMTVRSDGTRAITKWWTLEFNPEFGPSKSDAEYAEEYDEMFTKVMRRHLIADVPLGFNLSGGLDSSGVVGVASQLVRGGEDTHTGGKFFTFSALFPGETIDETRYITEVEKFAGSTPVYSYPKADEFWGEIMPWVHTQEEPTISSAPYAYYSVFREASKHVKVSLSGNGGDETLAGYLPYFRTYLQSAAGTKAYGRMLAEGVRGVPIFWKQYLQRAEQLIKGQGVTMTPFLGESLKGFRDITFGYSPNLNERLSQDVTKYSTPNLLRYEDKNSMAFGLESRVPFLDSELVEFTFNLPIDQKIKNGWTRYVYRNAMKGHMPELNRLRRSKIGFTNPETAWLKHNAPHIKEIFASTALHEHGLFDQQQLLDSFDRWLGGNERIDSLVYWRILVSQLWIDRFELTGVA
jgi:asparagine synthase (glutamine-hydrolysing)